MRIIQQSMSNGYNGKDRKRFEKERFAVCGDLLWSALSQNENLSSSRDWPTLTQSAGKVTDGWLEWSRKSFLTFLIYSTSVASRSGTAVARTDAKASGRRQCGMRAHLATALLDPVFSFPTPTQSEMIHTYIVASARQEWQDRVTFSLLS